MKKYFNQDSINIEGKATRANWNFPKINRYSFCNTSEFTLTRTINKGTMDEQKFLSGSQVNLDSININMFDDTVLTASEYFAQTNTDGLAILKNNELVFEQYYGYHSENHKHIMMSATKSITGMLLVDAIGNGLVNFEDKITKYIPELIEGGFDKVSVRNILDMQLVLDFSEDYNDPTAQIWDYAKAMGFMEKGEGYTGPETIRQALAKLEIIEVGNKFLYTTPITDLCAWVLCRATDSTLTDLVYEKIYSKLGMEFDASYSVDSVGVEIASGALNITLRDALKIGKLMLDRGHYNGSQLLHPLVFEELDNIDSSYIKAYGYSLQAKQPGKEAWSYKNQIWIMNTTDQDYAFIGVHGQIVYVNPKREIVVVKQGSNDLASTPLLGYQISVIQQLCEQL